MEKKWQWKNQVKTELEEGECEQGNEGQELLHALFSPQYSSMEGKEAHDKDSKTTPLPTFLYSLPLKFPLSLDHSALILLPPDGFQQKLLINRWSISQDGAEDWIYFNKIQLSLKLLTIIIKKKRRKKNH